MPSFRHLGFQSSLLFLSRSRNCKMVKIDGSGLQFKCSSLTTFHLNSHLTSLPKDHLTFIFPPFSTVAMPILVQARDPALLSSELCKAVDEHRFEDAWKLYEKYTQMENGFPRKSILNTIITSFAETCSLHWLEKSCKLVEAVFEKNKHELLDKESLIYICYILARSELPIPATSILRKMVETEKFLPLSALSAIIAFMSQSSQGAYLSAELISEIGFLFYNNRVDPRKKINQPLLSMKPDTTIINVASVGCLLSGTSRKAEQLLEMMPKIGVKMDVNTMIIMSHIYERNGRREEIMKLKRHIDETCGLANFQFQQFYNCLLSCHLKFGDLDTASKMVLQMLRNAKDSQKSLDAAQSVLKAMGRMKPNSIEDIERPSPEILDNFDEQKVQNLILFSQFTKDRNFERLRDETKEALSVQLAKLQVQVELVKTEQGILRPTKMMYAKLVKAFLEAGKVSDLAEFLIEANKEEGPVSNENSVANNVIDACISLKWLDQAHDLLDEMKFAGVKISSSIFSALIRAYCKENMLSEVESVLKDARKVGIQLDSQCYEALIQSRVLKRDTHGALHLFKEMKDSKISKPAHQEFDMLVKGCSESGEAGFMAKLLDEIKEDQKQDCGVHDWNSVIHFFCKKRLMHDAEKALKKMKLLGHVPNAQTFHSLATGYAAIGGKYVEVTALWGEMKTLASSNLMKFDQEVLDSLLYCFVRGGFFLRANEVVDMMEKENHFIDKYKYRTLFLKYHKTLYKGKPQKFQTEAQIKRREAAVAFKNWIGLG